MKHKAKCWCEYPVGKCPNISCEDAFPSNGAHRELLIASVHWYASGAWQPAILWCESERVIKFCPVCGRKLRRSNAKS